MKNIPTWWLFLFESAQDFAKSFGIITCQAFAFWIKRAEYIGFQTRSGVVSDF
jgi:hypothetical protein